MRSEPHVHPAVVRLIASLVAFHPVLPALGLSPRLGGYLESDKSPCQSRSLYPGDCPTTINRSQRKPSPQLFPRPSLATEIRSKEGNLS